MSARRFTGYIARDGRKKKAERSGYILHCAICGSVMFSSRHDARYCSGACRQKAYRMRLRMARRASAMAGTLRELRTAL